MDLKTHPARRRFIRLMQGMGVATTLAVVATWGLFYHELGFVSIHFFIATGLGVAFAMMLMAVLMGLVFLSSGSGHDEDVRDATERED